MNSKWVKADEVAEPEVKPIDEVEKDRRPAPAQPTSQPQEPEPVSMNELLKAFEQASKELVGAGLSVHKAAAAMQKVTSSAGRTPAEMSLISKAEGLISQIEDLRARTEKLAQTVSAERTKLLGQEGSSNSGWTR